MTRIGGVMAIVLPEPDQGSGLPVYTHLSLALLGQWLGSCCDQATLPQVSWRGWHRRVFIHALMPGYGDRFAGFKLPPSWSTNGHAYLLSLATVPGTVVQTAHAGRIVTLPAYTGADSGLSNNFWARLTSQSLPHLLWISGAGASPQLVRGAYLGAGTFRHWFFPDAHFFNDVNKLYE